MKRSRPSTSSRGPACIPWTARSKDRCSSCRRADARRVRLQRQPRDLHTGNADAANGLITQQGGSWFDGKRNTYALFAETVAPITDKLELDAAVRVDKYPNFSANVAPKIGFSTRRSTS